VASWKEKRIVMQRYDLTAEMYDERYSYEQKAKYRAALENLDVAGDAVLDVGCGSGLLFTEAATKAKLVVGVDVSHKLLLKAKEQAKPLGNVSVLQADADHLPFRECIFGFVFAFTILQNMPEPPETLVEFKRVAKLGGCTVVTGLKKAFPLSSFTNVLAGSGLHLVSFVDRKDLKCYVAVLTT